jgi:hypothetical protein
LSALGGFPIRNFSFGGAVKESNVVKEKSYLFALRVVKLYRYLVEEKKEYLLAK